MRRARRSFSPADSGTRMRAADPNARLTPEQQRAAEAGSKAMMPIGGRPFLDYLLSAVADAGIRRVGLVVAPAHETLAHHYRVVAPPLRLEISFVVQPEPRGTADAVLAAEVWTGGEPFLVMNGDDLYPANVLRDLAALDEPGLPGFHRGDLVASSNIPDQRVASFALIETDDLRLPDGHYRETVRRSIRAGGRGRARQHERLAF